MSIKKGRETAPRPSMTFLKTESMSNLRQRYKKTCTLAYAGKKIYMLLCRIDSLFQFTGHFHYRLQVTILDPTVFCMPFQKLFYGHRNHILVIQSMICL